MLTPRERIINVAQEDINKNDKISHNSFILIAYFNDLTLHHFDIDKKIIFNDFDWGFDGCGCTHCELNEECETSLQFHSQLFTVCHTVNII